MPIHIRGPIGRAIFVVVAIGGFVLALGDVLDFYDAHWPFTVPLTLVYAALVWRFALAPAKGEAPPRPVWPLGLDLVLAKLAMTVVILLVTLGVVALGYDLVRLVAQNWPYVVAAGVIVAGIILWACLPERKSRRRPGAEHAAAGEEGLSADDVDL
jgi:hypothetical protein